MTVLKARSQLGKYVIERKLGEGGFAAVYQARDTIEGIRVALKVPYAHLMTEESLNDFRHEVRLAAKLEHPNIVPLKYADFVEGRFVMVTALGLGTLDARLSKRLSARTALHFAAQMLDAVAYAHANKIIHCDLKPDNFLLFPNQQIRLTDFGIALVANKTLKGSGAGTVGYVAPEQALGKPSFRSDVFSLGLILYRMFSGQLPEWPYEWPPPGETRLRRKLHPDMVAVIRRAMQVNARLRYRDAAAMLAAFKRVRTPLRTQAPTTNGARKSPTSRRWQEVRRAEFLRTFGRFLETTHACKYCKGPVSECMLACPWCGKERKKHTGSTRFTLRCPRCHRGMKSDWRFCPWCFGPGFEPTSKRVLPDRRYVAKCSNPNCERKELMAFMKYCPWCRRRVNKKWKIEGAAHRCGNCGCDVLPGFWSYCPWCQKRIHT